MGRPKILIRKDHLEFLCRAGLSQAQISFALGISPDTLRRRMKEKPELAMCMLRSRAEGVGAVADALYKAALYGNVHAMIYYLDHRAIWSDGMQSEFDRHSYRDSLVMSSVVRKKLGADLHPEDGADDVEFSTEPSGPDDIPGSGPDGRPLPDPVVYARNHRPVDWGTTPRQDIENWKKLNKGATFKPPYEK